MFEKYVDNPCNYWRSLRIAQQWGDEDIINPNFVFGCNNLLDTNNIEIRNIFNLQDEYFKTNGEDIEFSKYLKEKKLKIYYSSESICYTYKMMTSKVYQIGIGDIYIMAMVLKKEILLKQLKI